MLSQTQFQERDREFWLRWLQKYKTLRCLWDPDEKRNKTRHEINEAYQELANFSKEIYPNANISFVKSRIISLRASYRRERRKIKAAKENGTEYTPSLFYYKNMKFLNGEDFEEDPKTWDEDSNASSSPGLLDPDKKPAPILKKREVWNFEPDNAPNNGMEGMIVRVKSSGHQPDEFELFGRRIAAHFREMDAEQWLMAEKVISEICVYGRLNSLTMQTCLKFETPEEPDDGNESPIKKMEKLSDCEDYM